MKIWEKLSNFIVFYRLPSQSQDDFETFLKNFELNLDTILANNSFLTVVLGDFNVGCKSDKTSYEGSKIKGITSQFGLQQLIIEPTHHTRNSSSCIDLIVWQANLVMESSVHSSLRGNCHHQIIYAKFNLKMFIHLRMNKKSGIIKKQTLKIAGK